MEDLSFRFLEPETYKQVATLAGRKTHRAGSLRVERLRQQLADELAAQGVHATVQGRPEHIYSIVKKTRGKSLGFEQVYDIRALRIVVPTVPDCYAALSLVHTRLTPITEEFDDYIARPKPNGYQSLHTVVRDAGGRPIEVQIRTQAMHDHAEHGVAAHWAYKEAGAKGYGGRDAPPASTTPRLLCCASCWPGSATSPAPMRPTRARACLTTASMCSRRMPPLWSCRRGNRGGLCRTACTPTWATVAGVPRWMGPWCR